MSTFTCITCQVLFPDSEIQREHYKTDWHRYNLKRKVAELPPVTIENFQARVFAHQNLQKTKSEETDFCGICHKHFSNRKSYENHIKSKKHQEAIKKTQQSSDSGRCVANEEGSERKDENKSNDLVKSLNLKNLQSSQVVKKNTTLVNVSNVSDELETDEDDDEWEDVDEEDDGEVEIGVDDCFFCSEHSETAEDNVKHMTNAHSFFIPDVEYLTDFEGLISYLAEKVASGRLCLWCNEKGKAFHSLKAVQQHMVDKGHCKMLYEGDALLEYVDFYDYSSSYPADQEEGANVDEEVQPDILSGDDFQLVLPSGATIGHRSLVRYYKQNIPPKRRTETKSQKMVQHVLSHYRALGYSEATQEITSKRARDVRYFQMVQAKNQVQQGIRNNKLQKHVRLQYRY